MGYLMGYNGNIMGYIMDIEWKCHGKIYTRLGELSHKRTGKSTHFLAGKINELSTGPFSIAN